MRLRFTYKNHHGLVKLRTVDNAVIRFLHHPGYDYHPGWFICGIDADHAEWRHFSLHNVMLPSDEYEPPIIEISDSENSLDNLDDDIPF